MKITKTRIVLTLIGCSVLAFAGDSASCASVASELAPYGPENLLRTLKTPFNTGLNTPSIEKNEETSVLAPIAFNDEFNDRSNKQIMRKLNCPHLFLPDRMILGKTSEFLVKGKPGMFVAIAMADKNTGARPILGKTLRLGPDRKLVTVGRIPENGILSLFIETPIQGDLVGSQIFFEAALWSKLDFSDLELASTIPAEKTGSAENGVIVATDVEAPKTGLFVLDKSQPLSERVTQQGRPGSINTGRP